MKSFAQIDRENNGDYVKLLTSVASLSGLFSDSETPLINYRSAENIFCRSLALPLVGSLTWPSNPPTFVKL